MWINPETLEVFVRHDQIRRAFPNTSFPPEITEDIISSFGILSVQQAPQPTFNRLTQKVIEAAPENVNGVWRQVWSVVGLTPDEMQRAAAALQADIVAAVQKRLDDFARTRNYDGILSACTYATSTVLKFQAEGQYAVNARDQTWSMLYAILTDVQSGTRPAPTSYADIEPDLPVLTWPN